MISNPLRGGETERRPARDRGLLERAPAKPRWRATKAPRHRRLGWLLYGARPEPVPSHQGPVEPPKEDKLGICCSGGGIRSAAFSLGALQTLQQRGQLRKAAYLAAVSGGSYIAAALSMVAKAGPDDSDAALLKDHPPFEPGSPEEQYLRNRSSYLAPTLTDKIYLGWRVLLALLVNLAFIAMPLVGIGLVLAGLLYAPTFPDLGGQCSAAGCAVAPPAWTWIAPLGVLGLSALCGVLDLVVRSGGDRRQRALEIWSARLLIGAAVLAFVLLGLPALVDWLDGLGEGGASVQPSILDSLGSIGAGFAALVAGVVAQLVHLFKSKEVTEDLGRAQKAAAKLGAGVRLALAYAAGAVVGPLLLLLAVAIAIAVAMAQAGRDGGIAWGVVLVGAGVLAAFCLLYRCADLTTWSLHPYYKRRLSSAFALKRVRQADLDEAEGDRVEAIVPTAGEEEEGEYRGLALERDYDRMVALSDTALDESRDRQWPTLLVCAAANVSDPGVTPPGRQVTSFTFSAHAIGGPLVGAVSAEEMEGAFDTRRRKRDLTLPAAVAMSGAAVSPSMGKMTKRPLTFLMALANIRLGVWVPNPRWVAAGLGEEHRRFERERYGRPRPWYLLCELLGRNRVDARYLYVTDGGHYENLGLVELLRRGCTQIYCFDASGVGQGKAEFDALGDAIALARSELGVEIDFAEDQPDDLEPDPETHLAAKDVVTGRIRYTRGEEEEVEGTLVYVRNSMTAKATWDARAHQREDPRFPHNSTVDQLYTDKKFESYRVLGARAARRAVKAMRAA